MQAWNFTLYRKKEHYTILSIAQQISCPETRERRALPTPKTVSASIHVQMWAHMDVMKPYFLTLCYDLEREERFPKRRKSEEQMERQSVAA